MVVGANVRLESTELTMLNLFVIDRETWKSIFTLIFMEIALPNGDQSHFGLDYLSPSYRWSKGEMMKLVELLVVIICVIEADSWKSIFDPDLPWYSGKLLCRMVTNHFGLDYLSPSYRWSKGEMRKVVELSMVIIFVVEADSWKSIFDPEFQGNVFWLTCTQPYWREMEAWL
jgi:hypothetical protein